MLIAFGSVSGLFVLALALGIYSLGSNGPAQNPTPSPSPSPSNGLKWSTAYPTYKRAFPVVMMHFGSVYRNVTRGSSFSIYFELQNLLDSQTEAVLTFETTGRDPQSPLSALDYINATYNAANPVTLQSRETKSLTLTVSIADDTPFGKYLFVAWTESLDFDGGTFREGYDLGFTVVP
jgi:hypothetical protein